MAIIWQRAIPADPAGLFDILNPIVRLTLKLDKEESHTFVDFTNTIVSEMETVDELDLVVSQFVSASSVWRTSGRSPKRVLVSLLGSILAQYIAIPENLNSSGLDFLLGKLQEFMVRDGQTVLKDSVSFSAVTYLRDDGAANVGSFDILFHSNNGLGHAGDYINQYIFTQAVKVVCVRGGNEGASIGSESFEIRGQEVDAGGVYAGDDGTLNPFQNQGTLGTIAVISSASGILTNGGFESWTGAVADYWVGDTAAYTDEAAVFFMGLHSALATVTTALTKTVTQAVTLTAQTSYLLSVRLRLHDAGSANATVTIEPTGTGYVFNAGEKIIEHGAAGGGGDFTHAAWVLFHTVFNTPEILPPDMKISISVTETGGAGTALVLIDEVILTKMTYFRGVGVTILSGGALCYAKDQGSATITNDYAGLFQSWFGRFFNISLPSATTPAQTITEPAAV